MEFLKFGKGFSQLVIVRAPGLLPMLYTPRELEQELGVPSRTIRAWIKYGMPFQKDNEGHVWIDGVEFSHWVEKVRSSKAAVRLSDDEAFCLHCKKPVRLTNPSRLRRGMLLLTQGKCPGCGRIINRGGRIDQSK
jgi:hypothetical protein